jgi:putative membrane protein insertion efficiency factor
MRTLLKVLSLLLATKNLIILVGVWAIIGQIAYNPTAYCESETSNKDHVQSPASFFVRFYQRFISVFDGNKCPMYPSCSHYSLQCLKKHGFFIGWIMTCDRLLHEPDEMHLAPMIIVNGNPLAYDPVQANDQWWLKKEKRHHENWKKSTLPMW